MHKWFDAHLDQTSWTDSIVKCEMQAYLFFEFGLWLCGSMRTRGRYGLQWLLVIVNLQRICHFAAGGGGVSGGGSYSVSTSSYRSSCSNGTMVKISSKRLNEIWQEFEGGKSCQIIALLNVNTAIWQVFELVENRTVLTSFSPSCSRGRQRLWWRHNNSLSSLWRKKNFNRHLEAIGGQSAQSITVEASSFNFRWRHWWFKGKILFHQLTVRHFTLFYFTLHIRKSRFLLGVGFFWV